MSGQPVESARAVYWTGLVFALAFLAFVIIAMECAV